MTRYLWRKHKDKAGNVIEDLFKNSCPLVNSWTKMAWRLIERSPHYMNPNGAFRIWAKTNEPGPHALEDMRTYEMLNTRFISEAEAAMIMFEIKGGNDE